MKKKLFTLLYITVYATLVALSFGAFIVFRPFMYVENNQSSIICTKDKHTYETAPNLIFAIDDVLDEFNDAKARKLCEFQIIHDYDNTFKTPIHKNYMFIPKKEQESSLFNGLFASGVVFILGAFIIELLFSGLQKVFTIRIYESVYSIRSILKKIIDYLIT